MNPCKTLWYITVQLTASSHERRSLRDEVMFGNLTTNNCCGIHLENWFFLYTFPYNPCNAQPALVLAEANIPWCFQNTGQSHVNRMQLKQIMLSIQHAEYKISFALFCFVWLWCSGWPWTLNLLASVSKPKREKKFDIQHVVHHHTYHLTTIH